MLSGRAVSVLFCVVLVEGNYIGEADVPNFNNYYRGYGRKDGYSTKLEFYHPPSAYDSYSPNRQQVSPFMGKSAPIDYNGYSPYDVTYSRVGKGFNLFGTTDLDTRYNQIDNSGSGYEYRPTYPQHGYGYTYTAVNDGQQVVTTYNGKNGYSGISLPENYDQGYRYNGPVNNLVYPSYKTPLHYKIHADSTLK